MTLGNSPHRFLAGLAIVAAVILTPTAARAQGGPIVVIDLPFTDVMENPCIPGEMVTVTGRTLATVYERIDGDNTHLTLRIIVKGQGNVLVTAKKYLLNDEDILETNSPMLGSLEVTKVINSGFIRQGETFGDVPLGSGDDFMSKTTFHLTIANGVPTAEVMRGQPKCN
jgi:hypothetical protein